MDRGNIPPLRSLPRIFVPGADPEGAIDLPKEEVEKLRKVLRLAEGDPIAVLGPTASRAATVTGSRKTSVDSSFRK